MDLHIIWNGIFTNQMYTDGIFIPHVAPYIATIGDSFVPVHDDGKSLEKISEMEIIQHMK